MKALFEGMKKEAELKRERYSAKSSLVTAINYFLKNYTEFTIFLYYPFLPIDNNHQERLLRNPVIGRKTWFGTHSKHLQLPTSFDDSKCFPIFNYAC